VLILEKLERGCTQIFAINRRQALSAARVDIKVANWQYKARICHGTGWL
jgi:hypothetical protein